MPHEPTLIHLVYIHGFNGDETTFQSFPTDLQQYLTGIIPPNSRYTVQSSLYPTYKSVKPISTCTRNFLEWLNTQPPGYVILLAHSMGGLLAAEAVTHASNNPESYPGARPSRIIGMIAFDVPFLGMHPHVVITGLASLFSKDDEKETETQLNDQNPDVHMVDGRVTDDWESYKRSLAERYSASAVNLPSPSPSPSPLSPSPLGPSRAEMSPFPPSYESSVHSSSSSSLHSPSPSFAERAGGLLAQADGFLASKADDPLVRWARKHRADPFGAGKTWLVDHFQFGVCMFDPPGLTKRYRTLVGWNGQWVNYWTETVPRPSESPPAANASTSSLTPASPSVPSASQSSSEIEDRQAIVDNDLALLGKGTAELSLDSLRQASRAGTSAASTISSNDSPFVTPCGSPEITPPSSPIPHRAKSTSPVPPPLPPRRSAPSSSSPPPPPLPPRRSHPAPDADSHEAPLIADENVDSGSTNVSPEYENEPVDPADAKARAKAEKARQKAEKEAAKAAEKEAKARAKEEQRLAKEEQAREKARAKEEQARVKEEQEREKARAKEEREEHAKREKELTKQREAEQKELARQQKEQKQREKAQRQSYHFVVLPTGLGQILGGGEKWESVPIAGVDNEVAAHCGLFIRGQNLDYDGLVARVGRKVMEFCEKA